MNKLIAGLLGPLLLSACASLPGHDAPLPWDAQVLQGRLANGVEYRLVHEVTQPGRLDLRMTVNAGSVDEAHDQVGVAHLVEHMVFHSHAGHAEDLRARMLNLGWVQGRHFNAVTNYERTQYMLSPPAGVRQAPQALAVLGDMAFARDYSALDLERERPIVIEEWRGGLGVAQRMNEQRTASQRVGSRYPAHRTIGNEAAIRSASLARLQAFQASWYRPSNIVISAVGDFEPRAMLAQVEAVFGAAQASSTPPRDHRDLPLDDHLKVFRLQDPQSGSNQVALLLRLHEPGSRGTTRAAMRERLIDRMTLAALVDSLRRQPRQPGVRSLTAQKTLIGTQSTVLGIAAGVEGLQHEQALKQLLTEIERLRQHGFSEQDFAEGRAHIRALGNKTLANPVPRTFEQWVGLLNDATAPEARVVERHAAARRYLEVLPGIELKDLNGRLRLWLGSADRVLQFTVPGQAQVVLPSVAAVEALQAGIARQALAAPARQQATAPVIATYEPGTPGPAGRIVTRKAFTAEKVEHWTLGNGDRLVWLRRNGPDGKWLLQADSRAGYRLADAPAWRLQMAAQLAVRSGPAGAQAWRQGQGATVSLEHQPQRLQLNLSGAPRQLEALLQSYRLSQLAGIDPALFDEARNDLLQRLRDRPADVRARQDHEQRVLKYGIDHWQAPGVAALQQLEREQLQADWQRLARAPVTFYLMADVAADQLEPLVRGYLANLPRGASPSPQPTVQQPGQRRSDLAIALEPRAVLQASSFQLHAWQPQAAMRVALLRELANQQLKQQLRGEASGVYRLNFDAQLSPDTQRIESSLSFSCDPARVDELWALAQHTLAGLHVDEQWLQSQRRELVRQEAKRREDPQTQFKRLVLSERHWQDPRYLSQQAELPEALTLPAMQQLARELFPAANQVQLRLLPLRAVQEQGL